MIKKTNKGGLFYQRKRKPVRKYLIVALAIMLAGFGLSILVSENTTKADAGSSDTTASMVGIYTAGIDSGTASQTKTLVKSTGGRGLINPLIKKFSVNLVVQGETETYDFIGHATVEDLIKKADITLEANDEISKRPDTSIASGDTVSIVRVTTETFEESVETPFETEYVEDATMDKGTTLVTQEGLNRVSKNVYTITYNDGVEVSRDLEYTEVTQEGQKKIVAQGTKEVVETTEPASVPASSPVRTAPTTPNTSPSQSSPASNSESNASASDASTSESSSESSEAAQSETANNETSSSESSSNTIAGYSYSKTLTCTAFAYTAPSGARGASGNLAVEGTCAVDPSVIPMGTRLYIEGYGYAVANDTGGAIIGNTIDVFYDTYDECVNWGRRTVTVYILD